MLNLKDLSWNQRRTASAYMDVARDLADQVIARKNESSDPDYYEGLSEWEALVLYRDQRNDTVNVAKGAADTLRDILRSLDQIGQERSPIAKSVTELLEKFKDLGETAIKERDDIEDELTRVEIAFKR